jgi:hypothetical protein
VAASRRASAFAAVVASHAQIEPVMRGVAWARAVGIEEPRAGRAPEFRDPRTARRGAVVDLGPGRHARLAADGASGS